jgi:hypothetical protein
MKNGGLAAAVLSIPKVIQLLLVEIDLVDLDVVLPFVGHCVLGKDRADRADRLTGTAIDALIGVDEIHVVGISGVNTIHRTNVAAARVLDVDARLGDHIGHRSQLLR